MASIFSGVAAPAPRYMMRLAQIDRLVEMLPASLNRFLEIGPGMGDVSLYLRKRFPAAKGVLLDFSGESVGILKQRFADDDRVAIQQADFGNYPHEGLYDLVIACEVLEHIEDDVGALATISQLLNAGGHFIFSVPAFMRKWQHGDEYAGHYRRYEREEIERKFAAAGFEIEQLWCYGFPVTELTYPLRQLYYGNKRRATALTKEEATKKSGVERQLAKKFQKLPLAFMMRPFFLMQHWARDTNTGDGFLVLARKL